MRASRWVNNAELYDLQADPGEKTKRNRSHPEEVAKLRAAYEQWWTGVRPLLVNENVTGPEDESLQGTVLEAIRRRPGRSPAQVMDPATTDFQETGGRKKAAE